MSIHAVGRPTLASWINRLDEAGLDALVQLREPVNKFPDFVRDAVQRLKSLCPTLGKEKLAEILARATLRLGATSVAFEKEPLKQPVLLASGGRAPIRCELVTTGDRRVKCKHPNHVWHVDLTMVPTQMGLWCSWSPWALPHDSFAGRLSQRSSAAYNAEKFVAWRVDDRPRECKLPKFLLTPLHLAMLRIWQRSVTFRTADEAAH